MEKPSIKCALLATLVSSHGWGSVIDSERLISHSSIGTHEYFEAREKLDGLRRASYVTSYGVRGVGLNNNTFGALADVLYYECNWEPFEIELRLKHYEGWDDHEWA
jgi:hypothetical protein